MKNSTIKSVINVVELMKAFIGIESYQINDNIVDILYKLNHLEELKHIKHKDYVEYNNFVDYINEQILPFVGKTITVQLRAEWNNESPYYNPIDTTELVRSFPYDLYYQISDVRALYDIELRRINSGELDKFIFYGTEIKRNSDVENYYFEVSETPTTIFI